MLFEPNLSFLNKEGLAASPVLVSPKIEDKENISVIVELINTGKAPITIHKNANLGNVSTFRPIADDLKCASVQTSQKLSKLENDVSQVDLSASDLTQQQKVQLLTLIEKYSHIFAKHEHDVGHTEIVKHSIPTSSKPIQQRAYRVPFAERKEVDKHIKAMLEAKIIRPSCSPWSSPMLLVSKKDGKSRLVTDFRKLNSVTEKDSYPLPNIADILASLGKAKYFSSLDNLWGFYQIEIEPKDREKTAFVTYNGLYEYNRLAMGLTGAPATFQRAMDRILHGLLWDIAIAFMDDTLVYSETFEKHLQDLEAVFKRLASAGIKLRLKKCKFALKEIHYLGHIICKQGIKPDPQKTQKVKDYPQPKNVTEVRAFIGLASYYRMYIKNFAKIAGPLHNLTKLETSFMWDKSCDNAFQTLKELLISAPILRFPDYSKPFILATDASKIGLGAVLSQIFEDNKEHPVAFASRSVIGAEKNYAVIELEALAVIWALKHFRYILYHHQITLQTDAAALQYVLKNPTSSSRLARWAIQLQDYDLTINYRAGKLNSNADAMSRIPAVPVAPVISDPNLEEEAAEEEYDTSTEEKIPDDLHRQQRLDPLLKPICDFLEKGNLPTDDKQARDILLKSSFYSLHENRLYFIDPRTHTPRLAVPKTLIKEILFHFHDSLFSGHLGFSKTFGKLKERFHWPNMWSEVKRYCATCDACAKGKPMIKPLKASLKPIELPDTAEPMDIVGMDLMGPLPQSDRGNRYVIVFCDYLTRYVEAFALKDIQAVTVARVLVEELICRYSAPRALLSDRGANLTAAVVKEAIRLAGVEKRFLTTAYHPQTDGLVERWNSTFQKIVRMYVNTRQTDWCSFVRYACFAYNTSPQESTKYAPFTLMFGREPRLPIEAALNWKPNPYMVDVSSYLIDLKKFLTNSWNLTRTNLTIAQERQKKQYNKNARDFNFEIGDQILVSDPVTPVGQTPKFHKPFRGPYVIQEIRYPNLIIKALGNPNAQTETIHVNRVKPIEKRQNAIARQGREDNPPELTRDKGVDGFNSASSYPSSLRNKTKGNE